jgi:hypothetical protein
MMVIVFFSARVCTLSDKTSRARGAAGGADAVRVSHEPASSDTAKFSALIVAADLPPVA